MKTFKTHALKAFIVAALFALLTPNLFSQQSSLGTDFWLVFNETIPEDLNASPPRIIDLQIFISSPTGASGTVTIDGIGFSESFDVESDGLITVNIPDGALIIGSNVIDSKGIRIESDNPISVYGLNQRSFSTDAYLALPINAWGSNYYVMSYSNLAQFTGSQFAVVAKEDNTVLTITPTATIGFNTAGIPFEITLDEGEVYQGRSVAGSDLTGTLVESSVPVGVFGSHFCANVTLNDVACDHLVEMLPPLSSWGQSFVTVPFAEREGGDVFRVLASTDNTQVTINGSVVSTLDEGEFYETILVDASSIETSEPALLAQFMRGTTADGLDGDPAMVLIPPREQFVGEYTVSTPASGFETNHMNIVVDNNGLGSILINGVLIDAEEFTPIAGTTFNAAQIAIELGTYNLTSNTAFGIFVYGTNPADSYAYPGGQIYSAVAEVNSLTLAPENSEAPAFSELCFEATLTDADGNPIEGVRIDFVTDGVNDASGFSFTNADGVATFCYSGENEGTDLIIAFQGDLIQEVSAVWTEPTFDCQGTPNGTALPGTECEVDGEFGIWSENCDCVIEAIPCELSYISFEELTDGCEDEQPMLDLVFDLTNPNAASEGTLFIDYANESIDDEEIIVEVPVDGGEFSQMITLESYGVMVSIELTVGEGDEQCSAASTDINLPIPECVTDCEGVVNGPALPGTSCNVSGISGFWNENCECIPSEPGECESYRYFLADNPTSGGDSKLYEYILDEENDAAIMEEILSLSYPFHIAYDGNAELVYIVRSANGNFRTLDVSDSGGELTEEVVLSEALANAVATGFDQNGIFYIGSEADGAIYTVDRETGMVTFFRNAPVQGGDLAFRADGNLYLATRANNGKVYELNTEGETSLVQNVPALVTGMAITENGDGLVSVRDRNRLYLGDDAGNQLGSYILVLDGEVFTTGNGDMASGCKESQSGPGCNNFVTYYTGYPQNGTDNELFAITLNEDNTLDLTQIEGFSTDDNHIAVSPDGLIYAVRGSSIDIFDPATASYAQQNIPIETESGQSLSGFPAATFDLSGTLFIGKSSNNTIYSVEIVGGVAVATVAFSGVDVSGGDLIATGTPDEQILWLINRTDNTLTNLLDNSLIPLELTEINGACLLEDGRLLLANGNSSEGGGLYALDLVDLSTELLAATGGPDVFFNGDLASGCVSAVAIQNFVSTAYPESEMDLTIAPNPTESVAFISYSTINSERMSLEVLDLQGRVVEVLLSGNQDQREGRIEFDGSALTNGIYLVRLISGNQIEVKKLIISH
ncbi:T9SS type A sorting domain-containing protein [Cryomorphaceae bacterium 1068]|nr:T9SS type A sorting domain-containing protein [Cryomorphaceae bacterium 1068]